MYSNQAYVRLDHSAPILRCAPIVRMLIHYLQRGIHLKGYFIYFRSQQFRNMRVYLLVLLWCIGIYIGSQLAVNLSFSMTDSLHAAMAQETSPLFLLLAVGLPVAACLISLRLQMYLFLYPVLFLVSICRGICGMLCVVCFGSGSWLIRPMLLFSSSAASVLMWWLLLRHSRGVTRTFRRDTYITVVILAVIVLLDSVLIAPYLSNLTNYF